MATVVYTNGLAKMLDGGQDYLTNTVKALLVGAGYTPDPDHDFLDEGGANDITDEEISGTNYAAGFAGSGRKTLAGKAVLIDNANNRVALDCDNFLWSAIDAGTAVAMVIYFHNTSDGDSIPIIYLDHNDVVTNGGDVSFTVPSTGFYRCNV